MIDPILQKAVTSDAPFCWSSLQLTPESQRILAESAKFNIGLHGYSVPYVDSQGRRSVLSIYSHLDDIAWPKFLQKNATEIENRASDVHVKAVSEAIAGSGNVPHLSPREIECLRWTSQGKTHTEIAIILDLSEHTIRSYLKVARIKLDSVSLAQAVAKASKFGFI